MEKEIRQLINRYMDGQTTIDEEQKIADYLRKNTVPEDLKRYKEMFAWFDSGMPLYHDDNNNKIHKKQPLLRTITKTVIVSIAAAILTLIVMTWKHGNTEDNNINDIVSLSPTEYTQQSDTINTDSTINMTNDKKGKTKALIRRYIMPIPKSLIAYNTSDSIKLAYNMILEKDLDEISKRQEEAIIAIIKEYDTNISDIETTLTALEEDFTEMTNDDY